MIIVGLAGLWMDQHVEAATVEHQPRDKPRELADREGNLIHRGWVRADRFVVPAPEFDSELLADRLAQALRRQSARGIVINMGMIAANLSGIGKRFCHVALSYQASNPAQRRRIANM